MPETLELPEQFTAENGILKIEGIETPDLAHKYGTPLYITSEARVRQNYRHLHEAFSQFFEKFSIKFAVKANSNPKLISILAEEGSGADVSNLKELQLAEVGGIPAKSILVTPNNLEKEELLSISSEGVAINFDDIGQMEYTGDSLPPIVSFRINPGIGKGEFPGTVTAGPEAKFGIPEHNIFEAYGRAKELGAKRFGIQMMTGSNVLDPEYFTFITSRLFEVTGKISKALGIDFEFVDIGGGFGVPYRPGEEVLPVETVAQKVYEGMKERYSSIGKELPELFIEPGRYLVSDSTVLLGKVTNVKSYGKRFIGTNIGMNDLLRPALYGAYHRVLVANRVGAENVIKADITGQICENTDRIAVDRELPDVRNGDIIAVLNAGAYGYSMSNNFNGHGKPAEVLITNGSDHLIRRRETLEDMLRNVV